MNKYIVLWVYINYKSIKPDENKGGYIEYADDIDQAIKHFNSIHNMNTCNVVGIIEWCWSSPSFRNEWNMTD